MQNRLFWMLNGLTGIVALLGFFYVLTFRGDGDRSFLIDPISTTALGVAVLAWITQMVIGVRDGRNHAQTNNEMNDLKTEVAVLKNELKHKDERIKELNSETSSKKVSTSRRKALPAKNDGAK